VHFEQAYDPVRCLHAAWALVKRAPATVVLGALVPLMVQYGMSFGMQFLVFPVMFASQRSGPSGIQWFFPVFAVAVLVVSLAQLVFQSWIDVGYARAVRDARATQMEQFGTIFRGGDRLLTLLLVRFLVFLICLGAYAVAALALMVLGVLGTTSAPGLIVIAALLCVFFALWCALIYVLLGFQFATPIVAFESCTATEAIGRSWRIADGRRWRLIVFWLFLMLIGFAGLLACGIGLLLAWPLIESMRIEAYIALKGRGVPAQPEAAEWGSAPPPLPTPPSA